MKLTQYGRATVTLLATAAVAAGLASCTNTKLGYLFVSAQQTGSTNSSGQLYSFRVDSSAGALSRLANKSTTQSNPTGTSGANPSRIALAGGGQFLYVLNQGSSPAGIALFTVGGDGTVFYQQTFYSQGLNPQDIRLSSDGGYLYVADQTNPEPATCPSGLSACGDITVFQVDQTTGKLTLVTNYLVPDPANPTQNLPYFPVGVNPYRLLSNGAYVYALDNAYLLNGSTNSEIFVYQVVTSGQNAGALQLNGQSTLPLPFTGSPTAATFGGSYMYVGDSYTNSIYQYNISGGTPQPIAGNPTQPISMQGATGPTDIAIEPQGRFLYVSAGQTSQIVGYTILTSTAPGALQYNASGGQGPTTVSSGPNPQCIAITGGREFIYTANLGDGSVGGYQIDNNTGQLRNNITSVKTANQATCLTFSSRTD